MAKADLTYSPLAPAVDRPPLTIADARGPPWPHLGGPHPHKRYGLPDEAATAVRAPSTFSTTTANRMT
jgi:hypothetical protein